MTTRPAFPRLDAAVALTPHEEWVKDEVRRFYRPFTVRPGDLALDIGANIGYTSLYLLDRGAECVVAVEPDPANYARLVENSRQYPLLLTRQAAVVADGAPDTVELAIGGSTTMHRLVNIGRVPGSRPRVTVPAIGWSATLREAPYTLVKVDVEGAEYLYDWTALPATVREVLIEWHLTRVGERAAFAQCHGTLVGAGFAPMLPPKDTGKNWTTRGYYVRVGRS